MLVHTHSPPHRGTIIGVPTYTQPDIYVMKFPDGTVVEYSASSEVLRVTTKPTSVEVSNILPDWVKGGAPATLFLNHMSKPRNGRLNLILMVIGCFVRVIDLIYRKGSYYLIYWLIVMFF